MFVDVLFNYLVTLLPYSVDSEAKPAKISKVKALIKSNPYCVNYRNKRRKETPLSIAVLLDDNKCIKCLLENGADPNITCGDDMDTLLNKLIRGNKLNIIYTMTKYNINLNQINKNGKHPLMLAVEYDSYPIANMLLKHGSMLNSNCKNILQNSVYGMYQETFRSYRLTKLLLENGAYLVDELIFLRYRRYPRFEMDNFIKLLLLYGAEPYIDEKTIGNNYDKYEYSKYIQFEEVQQIIKEYRRIPRLHTMCVRIIKRYDMQETLPNDIIPLLLLQIEEDIPSEFDEYIMYSSEEEGED